MPRRILACLLPLFCLLLTACTDTPSGQLTPVDVYVPPVTDGSQRRARLMDADARRRDVHADLPLHNGLAALAVRT